jgi:hypothetical protein
LNVSRLIICFVATSFVAISVFGQQGSVASQTTLSSPTAGGDTSSTYHANDFSHECRSSAAKSSRKIVRSLASFKAAEDVKEPSMATVFSHIHFCRKCNDTWTCVSWVCEEEDDGELTCQPCRVKGSDEQKPVQTLAKKRDPSRRTVNRSRFEIP